MGDWRKEQFKEDCFTLILFMGALASTVLIGKMLIEVLKF